MFKEIIVLPDFNVIGLTCKTSLSENLEPQLWDQFIVRSNEITGSKDIWLGVFPYKNILNFGDFADDYIFEYIAGLVVENFNSMPSGMISRIIPSSSYAVFTHKGSLDNLEKTYKYIFRDWFKNSGYLIKEADQIEIYDERFTGLDNSEMEICIPIVSI